MAGFMNRPAPYDARDRFGGSNRFRNMGGGGPNGMGRNFRGTWIFIILYFLETTY